MRQAAGFRMQVLLGAITGLGTLVVFSGVAFSQGSGAKAATASTARPSFIAADVHVSPHSNQPFERGGQIIGQKYELRDATMEDMIAAAYAVSPAHVFGGPPWIEWDHYDITAKAPPGTSQPTAMQMLQTLLEGRFGLVVKAETKPLPALALMLGQGKPKLKESAVDDSDPNSGASGGNCTFNPPAVQPPAGTMPDLSFSCKNMTMAGLASNLRYWGFGYYPDNGFVLDQTGLKGNYDFDLHWSPKQNLAKEGPDGITIYDAIEKQLGLKLGQTTAPQPVMNIVSVNETPTPNVANLNELMPPWPPAVFDVAVIRPSRPDEHPNGRVNGGQVNVQGLTLDMLIKFAWQMPDNNDDMVVGLPKSLNEDHFDILAKATVPPPTPGAQNNMQITFDDLMHMFQVLIEQRFEMKWHMEDRPIEAYTLVAVNPKLAVADPKNRTACKEGPGADGKDPRLTNPILGALITCRNITMAQFAEQLQTMAPGYIQTPVLDATGLKGNYDFTLSYSMAQQLRPAGPPAAGASADSAADPTGGISLIDAVYKELGLKLEKEKRPVPVLVIDHIDQQPTAN